MNFTPDSTTVTSSDGTLIAVDRYGTGAALILVGGAFQVRQDPRFTEVAALLAPDFAVHSYDRRGRGASGDTAPHAVEREVEDLGAVIDAAGGSAVVFGMSSGAVLALDGARSLPVTRLALFEPPFIVDDSRPPLPPDYVDRLTNLAGSEQPGDAVEYFMTIAVGVPPEIVAQMRQAPFWPGMEAVAPTLAYDARIMDGTMSGRPLPTDRWSSVTCPTLVMTGGASPETQHAAGAALVALLPGARLRTLADQTHEVAPEALAAELRRFLAC